MIGKWLLDAIKSRMELRKKILTSNSGVSSKAWVMVSGMDLAKVVVFWYLTVLTIEMFTDYVLRSDWKTFGAVIVSLSVLIASAAYGKIKGEESYYGAFNSEESPPESNSINKEDGIV